MSISSQIEGAIDKYFSKNQKYFKSKKGENFELKNDLNSEYKSIRKDAVKRVIANMTLGKNVSELFADVLKCMQTDDLELKKLVYLYLMNYAKTQPELVILAVNTFVKDAEDLNPLIRALAIRTMGCLRAEKIVDYLFEPLRKGLQDPDPYVRKTATLCVCKMYTLAPDRTVEYGFIEQVEKMLQDDNPMVIANAIASLHEMRSFKTKAIVNLSINSQSLTKLLNALNECTEWGQIVIMESLCDYHTITDPEEAMVIADKTSARLQHQNPSVVLTAIRLIMSCLLITTPEFTDSMLKKVKGPIISLLNSTQSELLFSFLRNMHVIIEKYPNLLNNDLRPFFVKYNDPPYVKLEKLSLLRKLSHIDQVDSVLSELKEYASEVDIEFVSESIHSFTCIALKFPNSAEKCVNCLLDLLKTKIDYVCSDVVRALRTIIRKYPQFDKTVEFIAPYLQQVDGLPGKEAIIFLIGEYPGHVNGIYEVLELLVNEFNESTQSTQLNSLICIVKCFLKRPNDPKLQQFLQQTLTSAVDCQHPDIRDRAYVYWRLLSVNPELTRSAVWTKKPIINEQLEQWQVDEKFLSMVLKELSTLTALFHVDKQLFLPTATSELQRQPSQLVVEEEQLLDLGPLTNESVGGMTNELFDLALSPQEMPLPTSSTATSTTVTNTVTNLLPLMSNNEMKVDYKYSINDKQVVMVLQFTNLTNAPLKDFAIQFNKNSFGVVPAALLDISSLTKSVVVELPLVFHMDMYQLQQPFDQVQVAIKQHIGVVFGTSQLPLMVATFVPANAELLVPEIKGQVVEFKLATKKTMDQLVKGLQLIKSNNVFIIYVGVLYGITELDRRV